MVFLLNRQLSTRNDSLVINTPKGNAFMVHPSCLDCTPPNDSGVISAMQPFIETEFGNPSSSHWYGIRPKKAVGAARRQVAVFLNCRPEKVFLGHCLSKAVISRKSSATVPGRRWDGGQERKTYPGL
jgi:hypothetical protein